MNTKQKIAMKVVVLALLAGFSSVLFATTLQGATALAQTPGRDCSDLAGEEQATCEAQNEMDKKTAEADCQPGEKGCCGGVKTSIIGGEVCGDSGEGNVIFNLLIWVLRIMTAGVGVAAVGGIGYGALLYTTAEGKPDQTKKAIGIISNVVIGIGAYALMALLLNFLIPGGVFR